MWQDRSNTLDRKWRENSVANCGSKEMANGYEMLVEEGQVKLLKDSRIKPLI